MVPAGEAPFRTSFVWPMAYDWKSGCDKVMDMARWGDEHLVAIEAGDWRTRQGRTWGGGAFTVPSPDHLHMHLSGMKGWGDLRQKLRMVRADFWFPGERPEVVEVCERNALSALCRPGNWIAQVDADETWVNPDETMAFLARTRPGDFALYGHYLAVYKVIGDTALVFAGRINAIVGRAGIFQGPRAVLNTRPCPLRVVNWWNHGRSDAELLLKFPSMGYAREFDGKELLRQLRDTTMDNYTEVYGFGRTFNGQRLQTIALADLKAGRWDGLAGVRPAGR